MSNACAWLPELVEFESCQGDWARYVELLYEHFRTDFVRSKPRFPRRRWAVKRHPMMEGKEATFWHIISEGPDEAERLPDLRRCERIRWPRPLIDAFGGDHVRCWRNARGRSNRVLIAPSDFSYLVVLEDRAEYIMLWTAYHVEQAHQRRKLEREWVAYQAQLAEEA